MKTHPWAKMDAPHACCLHASGVRDHLGAIRQKVDLMESGPLDWEAAERLAEANQTLGRVVEILEGVQD